MGNKRRRLVPHHEPAQRRSRRGYPACGRRPRRNLYYLRLLGRGSDRRGNVGGPIRAIPTADCAQPHGTAKRAFPLHRAEVAVADSNELIPETPHSSEPRLALAHKERQRPAVVASSSRAAPDGRAMDDAAASKRARDSPERAIGCHRHGHQRLPMRPEGPLCATHRPPMRAQPALKRPVLLTYASDPHEPTQAKSAHVASPDADQAPQRPCSKSPQ